MTLFRHAVIGMFGLTGLVATTSPAAAEPCGGIRLGEGGVHLGEMLSLELAEGAAGEECLAAIAERLLALDELQTVTIAARVPNDGVMRERGMQAANVVANKLADLGMHRSMLSTVVPMGRADARPRIEITFVERRSARAAAQVEAVSGRVFAGPQLGQLRDVKAGLLLTGSDFVETGKGSVALLKLLDDSHLYLWENSAVRVGKVEVDDSGQRDVAVQLIRGEAVVFTSEREGAFYIATGNSIAGVRGTIFRIAQPEAKLSRVEVLAGTLVFGGSLSNRIVADGQGSQVDYHGRPDTPRPLLVSPLPSWPLFGRAEAGELLSWEPVPEAKLYRVELAQNAQFTKGWRVFETGLTRMPVPDTLTPGKWFWRVTGVDVDGVVGYPSKTYAFDLPSPL